MMMNDGGRHLESLLSLFPPCFNDGVWDCSTAGSEASDSGGSGQIAGEGLQKRINNFKEVQIDWLSKV